MIPKRMFWFGLGIGVGAAATVEARRRVQRAVRRASPDAIAIRAGTSVREFGRDVRSATLEGREAMRRREAELRDVP